VAAVGQPAAEPVVVPLVHLGERLGELRVSRRTEGEAFNSADRQLLDQLARQAAALVYGQRRDRELAAARRQTVDAVAEERFRLGRDLHDGLAPLLAGAGLSADALRRSFAPGSSDEHDAARLAALLRRTASDTRRMAYDLQPVDSHADIGADLTEYLASLKSADTPAFSTAIDVDELPVSIAQNAYLVLLEAINNIVRHAHASSATITVTSNSEALQLEVADDGVGLEQPYVSGVGIQSMRRRVESLGGTFAISRALQHGTCLSASIPLHLSA
jgi:signal transduction histidine kinase